MYQESVDKLKGNSKTDTVAFIVLVAFFLIAGTLATILRSRLDSNIPMYVLAAVFAALLYAFYKMRLVGWRYTVFYKEPEVEYDPRFDDYVQTEEHAYPVGTVVFERTVSAKGDILEVISKDEIVAFLEAGEKYDAASEKVFGPKKAEASSSIVFSREGKLCRIYFTPSAVFANHIRSIILSK